MKTKLLPSELNLCILFVCLLVASCQPTTDDNHLDPKMAIGVAIALNATEIVINEDDTEDKSIVVNRRDELLISASGIDSDGLIYTLIRAQSGGLLSRPSDPGLLETEIRTEATENPITPLPAIAYVHANEESNAVVLYFETRDKNGNTHVAPSLTIYFLPESRVLTDDEVENSTDCRLDQTLWFCGYKKSLPQGTCAYVDEPIVNWNYRYDIFSALFNGERRNFSNYCDGTSYVQFSCANGRIERELTLLSELDCDGFTYECDNMFTQMATHENGRSVILRLGPMPCVQPE